MVASPADLGETLEAIAGLASLHAMTIALGRHAARAAIGWDPGDPEAWRARGFDPEADIWISLAVGDGAERYRALTSAQQWTARTGAGATPAFWHLRAIARVVDARRARATATSLTAGLRDVEVFSRVRGDHLIVDVLRPMFSGSGAPVSRQAMRALTRDPPPARRFSHGALLSGPGLRGWLRADGLLELGRAMQRELHIELLRDNTGGGRGAGPWLPNPRCDELSSLVDGHLFTGLAVAVRPRAKGIDLELAATAASAPALAAALPLAQKPGTSAHRLPNLSGAAALRLAGLAGLRALPRPPAFESFTDALTHMRGCESHYGWTAALFGWPHLIGVFAEEIAALGPRGAAIAAGVSAASLGVAAWNRAPLETVAILEGALDPAAIAAATSLLDAAFGRPAAASGTRRWGTGRLRPYLVEPTTGAARIGATFGGSPGAALARRQRSQPRWLGASTLLGARIDLATAGPVLRHWSFLATLLGNARSLELTVAIDGSLLRARVRLDR